MNSKEQQTTDATVVLVPGIYTPRICMLPMARRLRQRGFKTRVVSNRFFTQTPAQNAKRILQQLRIENPTPMHLVGFSLGGIVVLHLLKQNYALPKTNQLPAGKVVLIATPANGSELAQKLNRKRWCRPLMGKATEEGLLGDSPKAIYNWQLGLIRGTGRFGLFAMLFRLAAANDGAVTVAETELAEATDAVSLPQSHAIMLFSRLCTEKVASFLVNGKLS